MTNTKAAVATRDGHKALEKKRTAQRKRADEGRCPIHRLAMDAYRGDKDDSYLGSMDLRDNILIERLKTLFPELDGSNGDRWEITLSFQAYRTNRNIVCCPRKGCDVVARQDDAHDYDKRGALYQIRGTGVLIQ